VAILGLVYRGTTWMYNMVAELRKFQGIWGYTPEAVQFKGFKIALK